MLMNPSDIPQLTLRDSNLLEKLSKNWRLTPATFAYKLSKGQWIPGIWLLYVSQIIATAIAKGNGRIIISAPPRHGKSQLVDIYTPAWVMENFPGYHVILASYGAELSVGFGRKVRDLLLENEDILNVRLRKDAKSVENFLTTSGNSMSSVGIGGSITGRGAHVLLIDDYIKEIKEALSMTYRNYIWNWFVTTAYTRLEPGGTVIIIATRWDSDDLIGRILKAFPNQWTNIVLPAVAEQNDILGRTPGDALFPERYPLPSLMERLEVLGSTFFQALYQQRPIDVARKLCDAAWIKIVDIIPALDKPNMVLTRVWDLAATEGGGDYTTGSLCAYDKSTGFFYVINIIRRQIGPAEVEHLILQTAIADGLRTPIHIEQEPGSAGKALVEHYQRTVLPEFKVEPMPVVNSKVLRAQPLLASAEAGKVFLLKNQWNDSFLNEFNTFPAGAYDDQVDTISAAFTKLSGKRVYSAVWGREQKAYDNSVVKQDIREAGKAQRQAQFSLAKSIGCTWATRGNHT